MNRARFCVPVVLLLGAIFAIVAFLWVPAFAQDKDKKVARPPVKWEYKFIATETKGPFFDADKTEETLNKLGNEGWEFVGTISDAPGAATGKTRMRVHLICKRPKQ